MTPDFPENQDALGTTFAKLHDPLHLAALDRAFRAELAAGQPELAERFERYRSGEPLSPTALSSLLVDAGRALSPFIASIFGVAEARERLLARSDRDQVLFKFRWTIFQKRIFRRYPDAASLTALPTSPAETDETGRTLVRLLAGGELLAADPELAVATASWTLHEIAGAFATPRAKDTTLSLDDATARVASLRAAGGAEVPSEESDPALIARLTGLLDAFIARLKHAPEHVDETAAWASLFAPKKLDMAHLVATSRPEPALPEKRLGLPSHARPRAGFDLTDPGKTPRQVLGEVAYCLLCHEREKDSCSKGFHEKDGSYRKNVHGAVLTGCPLDEKISEMHLLRREGDSLGALALIVIDNPMLPGTGHRICNDCMKGCIFQQQEPVDIPQAETGVLKDVLSMPWGFEIWSLLTRWNPLNRARPYALPYNGRNVLVVGLGPSGYTLAHHLANEGFGVVAVDALKIEPLPVELTGNAERAPRPIHDVEALKKPLDERAQSGFGGVSEYGITVRWDKNYLDLLYLNLARRRNLAIYGGVRFGGTVTMEQAFALGFDHIAIAAGAGKPTMVDMKNSLIRGVRMASDFLMALQLTGAFRDDALANLHVELPIVVVGGGLTAIDTATESLAFY
ncbi:MAG: FAD-dependent oxidoreductase, partial [Acidobacteria bacterium]|nr:FAD-dependent oxidoreductase [Acidobacteriota bacterium]